MTIVEQIYWQCSRCGHSWPQSIDSHAKSRPCPACADGKPQSWTAPKEDFKEFLDQNEGRDANHGGGWMDREIRRANKAACHELCDRCDGTGNQLFSMWQACEQCGGSGRAKDAR